MHKQADNEIDQHAIGSVNKNNTYTHYMHKTAVARLHSKSYIYPIVFSASAFFP